jgi:hypothetical protein
LAIAAPGLWQSRNDVCLSAVENILDGSLIDDGFEYGLDQREDLIRFLLRD